MGPRDISALIKEGAAELGIVLTEDHLRAFALYLQELRTWGKHINLVKRADDREIILKDFVDSMTILKYLPLKASMADLGSGAGFPGVPAKIVRPDLKVCLLESTQKKIFFLKNIRRVLNLQEIEILGSGEKRERTGGLGEYDFVVSRAFGSLTKFSSIGSGLLRRGGMLLAMKGKRGEEELGNSLPLLEEMGFKKAFVEKIRLPFLGHARTLIGLRKKEAILFPAKGCFT